MLVLRWQLELYDRLAGLHRADIRESEVEIGEKGESSTCTAGDGDILASEREQTACPAQCHLAAEAQRLRTAREVREDI